MADMNEQQTELDNSVLGQLPEPAGWGLEMHGSFVMFATNSEHAQGMMRGVNNPIFTANQMRAYASEQVAAACDALRKNSERWEWVRKNAITLDNFSYYIDDEVEQFVDAKIASALALG